MELNCHFCRQPAEEKTFLTKANLLKSLNRTISFRTATFPVCQTCGDAWDAALTGLYYDMKEHKGIPPKDAPIKPVKEISESYSDPTPQTPQTGGA